MSIDMFASPICTRPWTAPPVRPQPKQRPPEPLSWEDLSSDKRWEEALMTYLRQNWRGGHRLWAVVNAVVAEAMPDGRSETREHTQQALAALTELIRQRRVLRFRRKWIAALDVATETVPLDQIPADYLRRT